MQVRYRLIQFRPALHYFLALFILFLVSLGAKAQCPPNIDFEKGDFTGWETFIGRIQGIDGSITVIATPPTPTNHAIKSVITDTGYDYFGGFPIVCPNGSDFSVKLGNESIGAIADRVSYTFTIPANQNSFSLIYNYAVVLQDPGHNPYEQPRLKIEVLNLTDNDVDPCTSFDFVATASLPGFKISPKSDPFSVVIYKDWSAASINLDGYAGKTFKISFTTTDCALGGHFGYAYIDINAGCSSTLFGSIFCRDDKFVKISGPPGFQKYNWYNSSFIPVGTGQTLTLSPLPKSGDSLYVELTPYFGYGCLDTLTVYLSDSLKIVANAGIGQGFCVDPKINLGVNPKPGEVYNWSPSTGLSNPNISNPIASPLNDTKYILNVENIGGGCKSSDTVNLVRTCGVIEFYVPGAFTPNGDGINDRLRPVLYGYSKVNYFRVYNRYGQLLYSMNSDMPGWDGTIKGKPAGTQTVVWMIEAVDAFGKIVRRQGTTVLIR